MLFNNDLYMCDGKVEGCKKRGCYKNGGPCFLTRDPSHGEGDPINLKGIFIRKIEKEEE